MSCSRRAKTSDDTERQLHLAEVKAPVSHGPNVDHVKGSQTQASLKKDFPKRNALNNSRASSVRVCVPWTSHALRMAVVSS